MQINNHLEGLLDLAGQERGGKALKLRCDAHRQSQVRVRLAALSVTRTRGVIDALLICLLAVVGAPSLLFGHGVRLRRPTRRNASTLRECGITHAGLDGYTRLVDFRIRAERGRSEDKQYRADGQNAHTRLHHLSRFSAASISRTVPRASLAEPLHQLPFHSVRIVRTGKAQTVSDPQHMCAVRHYVDEEDETARSGTRATSRIITSIQSCCLIRF